MLVKHKQARVRGCPGGAAHVCQRVHGVKVVMLMAVTKTVVVAVESKRVALV